MLGPARGARREPGLGLRRRVRHAGESGWRGSVSNRMARMNRTSAVGLSALALVASVAAAQRPSAGAPFTEEERQRLLAGELVRRPDARREGNFSYIGGTSWMRVAAPREQVWEVIDDVSRYPRLIPGVSDARVVEELGSRRVIYLRHTYSFVSAAYHASVRSDRRRWTLTFELDPTRPHDVRDGRGFITLDRYGRGETIVTWGVMADVGSGIITGVFAPVIHDWILKVPWCVRGELEPSRRQRC